jgi:hypothetical protein
MSAINRLPLSIGQMHAGQVAALRAFRGHRFKALRCGRRFGKTDFGKIWIADGLARGFECAWLTPQHNTSAEVYSNIANTFRPLLLQASRGTGVIKLKNGGRLDLWTLGNTIAGRGRRYHRIVIDEAAFTKAGDNTLDGSMMGLWDKAIKPTLLDFGGEALVCSNTNGKDPENFFYNICTEPKFGFKEYHATTADNPLLPIRLQGETDAAWAERRAEVLDALRRDNDPLVYAQEYLAEFVDWSGVAFFSREKLLVDGQPATYPKHCDSVFAVIDTASKTGTDNDGTAVTYFARNAHTGVPLIILDWDIVQIEGAMLETWLPSVFRRLDELSRVCSARAGAIGAWIEDKNSGIVLLQQALNRGLNAHAIESKLTALGKDGRALSVSGYIHREQVKYSEYAFNKTVTYKQKSKNHLVDQVERFRMGDKAHTREDDLLDTFCYGIALSLGNNEGF